MADVYNTAHTLAKELKASEEYLDYQKKREAAYEDDTNRRLLDEYKRLQFRMQAALAGGQRPDEEELRRLQQIAGLLQFNPEARDYLMAELRFQKMMSDVYKILAEAVGIDIEALQG